jgi:diacylglycerol kinase (ATP)
MRAHAILGPGARQSHIELLHSAGVVVKASRQLSGVPDADLLIILGGDGTIHRFLPELILWRKPVLIAPCGSGNDLARALGIRSFSHGINLLREFVQRKATTHEIDVGIITDSSGKETPFCCTAGVGLDAAAAKLANRMPRWLRAHGGYLIAAANGVFTNSRMGLRISFGSNGREMIDQDACLFTIANTPSFGGGLPIAPGARLDDGEFDCVLADAMNRAKLTGASLSLLRGMHLGLPQVHFTRASRVRVESKSPVSVYADGEFVCGAPFEARVMPKALSVCTANA